MSGKLLGGIIVVAVLVGGGTTAFAADAQTGGGALSLVEFFKQAGIIGWIILALSVVVGGLWLEHMVNLNRSKLLPEDILGELSETADRGDRDEAARLCEDSPGFFTNVVAAGLTHVHLGAIQAGHAMQDVRDEETVKLFSRISWLKLISDIAPMLGLLGTVWGMMKAVGNYTTGITNLATFASQGIHLALITTLLGLIVAIIATSVYFFFRARLTRLSIEVGEAAEEMVLRIARQSTGQ